MRTGMTFIAGMVLALAVLCLTLKARTDRLQAAVSRQERALASAIERQPELSQADRDLLRALRYERRMLTEAERGKLPPLLGMGVQE